MFHNPVAVIVPSVNCEGNVSVTVIGEVSDEGLPLGTEAVNFTVAAPPAPNVTPLPEEPLTVLVIANVGAAWRFEIVRLLIW